MLFALIMPLLLLTALGLCVTRPDWVMRLAAAPFRESAQVASRPVPSRNMGPLGRRAPGDRQMSYESNGRAQLGEYRIKVYDPTTRTLFRTDFALEGETTCDDPQLFEQWVTSHHCLFREQVGVTLRSAKPSELVDPQLTVLSRRLVAQVNRMLGEPFLKSVQFKDFSLYQSVQQSDAIFWEKTGEHPSQGLTRQSL